MSVLCLITTIKQTTMIKKLMGTCIVLLAGFIQSNAQDFKAVKVDIGLGYAMPSNSKGVKAGATFTIEPHYRLNDQIAVGVRFEGAALGYQTATASGSDVKINLLTSYTASGEYYFSNNGFRPLVGAGMGIFTSSSFNMNANTGGAVVKVPSASNFGFYPRAGFETGHFRMTAEYNIIKGGGYFAAKLGFFFGGGRK